MSCVLKSENNLLVVMQGSGMKLGLSGLVASVLYPLSNPPGLQTWAFKAGTCLVRYLSKVLQPGTLNLNGGRGSCQKPTWQAGAGPYLLDSNRPGTQTRWLLGLSPGPSYYPPWPGTSWVTGTLCGPLWTCSCCPVPAGAPAVLLVELLACTGGLCKRTKRNSVSCGCIWGHLGTNKPASEGL